MYLNLYNMPQVKDIKGPTTIFGRAQNFLEAIAYCNTREIFKITQNKWNQ